MAGWAIALLIFCCGSTGACAATPDLLWQAPENGKSGSPSGIGVNAANGHLVVADAGNSRIDELDIWGQLVKAWGWGVVASGPGNKASSNEKQKLTVSATGGTYKLRYFNVFGGGGSFIQNTVAIGASWPATDPSTPGITDSVQEALEGLESLAPGDVVISGGPGDATGSSPYEVEFTGKYADSDIPPLGIGDPALTGGSETAGVQTVQTGGSFEICVPKDGDVCQAGQRGGNSPGQVPEPLGGVAVDGAGNVYVNEAIAVDEGEGRSFRVQKFDSEGHFQALWGGEVNKTKSKEAGSSEAERNLCTKAEVEAGDRCGTGVPGTGKGQFQLVAVTAVSGGRIAYGPGGSLFVGDKDRIQKFSPGGVFEGEVKVAGETIRSLAMDGLGNFYVALVEKNDVRKLNPAGTELTPAFAVSGPRVVAVDGAGNVYAALQNAALQKSVIEYDKDRKIVISEADHFAESGSVLSGLATSSACGISGVDLYVSDSAGVVRGYGPPPDITLCPPPLRAPKIVDQFAVSAGPDSAVVGAKINPRFWPDTHYYVEYGTGECSAGGCTQVQPAAPGSKLTEKTIDAPLPTAGVFLSGLQPATTYHYRFVAQSTGSNGEPVRGVGGTLAAEGAEGSFRTMPPRPAPPSPDPCPNASFRGGASASLPDCRAYEMVSPVDKNNGDILALGGTGTRAVLNQSSSDGEKLAYGSYRSFGDAQSAPITSAYLATRDPGTGWLSHGISPPRAGLNLFEVADSVESQFKAFSPDLCDGWLIDETDQVLAAGAIKGFPNLYRRDNCGFGADGYEALSTAEPPKVPHDELLLELQGISADGTKEIFRARDMLTADAVPCKEEAELVCKHQLYEFSGGALHFVCVLPNGEAASEGCSAGSASGQVNNGRRHAVSHAISADGERIFWSDRQGAVGRIYLRTNPDEEQSALAHVTGLGNLAKNSNQVASLRAAVGKGTLTEGSAEVVLTATTAGQFVVGQPIAGTGIPSGTTIVAVEGSTLTLSAAVEAGKSGVNVSLSSSGPVPFAVGQQITTTGGVLPPGTTITAVAVGSLTLSANPTANKTNAALDAVSGCTEPEKGCTIAVSEAGETASGKVGSGAQYWTAAADGSTAIFSVGDLNGQADLYEFDVASRTTAPIAHEVYGLLGASTDAKRVYLVSAEALAGGGVAGQPNLYLYEVGGGFSFVATLSKADALQGGFTRLSPVNYEPSKHTAEVSADGLHVAFMSTARPTGFDNTDAANGEADAEVYLFGAGGEGLRCISCNPTGARPTGRNIGGGGQQLWAAARIATSQSQLYRVPHVLSVDGRRLFFESFEPLVPADTNGKKDVYEREAPGAGSCTEVHPAFSEEAEGCVGLISSGEGSGDSELVDMSADGSNVFISTVASLLPQDPGLIDIYDARVGGGFPTPSPPEPFCEGEACQSPPAPPAEVTPASAAVRGAGNPKKTKVSKKKHRKHHKRKHHHRHRRAAR